MLCLCTFRGALQRLGDFPLKAYPYTINTRPCVVLHVLTAECSFKHQISGFVFLCAIIVTLFLFGFSSVHYLYHPSPSLWHLCQQPSFLRGSSVSPLPHLQYHRSLSLLTLSTACGKRINSCKSSPVLVSTFGFS